MMHVGIISNSTSLIPLACQLVNNKIQVDVFHSKSLDQFTNQRVVDFLTLSHIPFFEEVKANEDIYNWLSCHQFDACFIIGYGHLLDINKIGKMLPVTFNVHFGILPSYRGPTPIFWQLKHGVENIGMCIHLLSNKFDDGPIVWKKEVKNEDHFNCEIVDQYLSNVCVEGVFFILNLMANRQDIIGDKGDMTKMAYYHKPTLNDILIDWNKMGAKEICNLVRACNPWNRGAITCFKHQEMKLLDAVIDDSGLNDNRIVAPGEIIENKRELIIHTCDNHHLKINMFFYGECYIPAYYCHYYGLEKGAKIGI
ncbi:formyltransferase family protein [Prevotella sp.]|uniref:formyltransferase family protein n=1 Tax=Prevotella sp. TaxID=59823 RepID=UPI003DA59068